MTTKAKLPAPPREVPVCRSMDYLAPKFRAKVERVLAAMAKRGYHAIVYETLRTSERQLFLYGFGRLYDDGRGIVTHSRDVDDTWHGYGLAVDIVDAKLLWNAKDDFWRALEEEVEREGLTSGRDWDRNDTTVNRFNDSEHAQWGPPMRRSPSERAALLRRTQEGLPAVWREVGAL